MKGQIYDLTHKNKAYGCMPLTRKEWQGKWDLGSQSNSGIHQATKSFNGIWELDHGCGPVATEEVLFQG